MFPAIRRAALGLGLLGATACIPGLPLIPGNLDPRPAAPSVEDEQPAGAPPVRMTADEFFWESK